MNKQDIQNTVEQLSSLFSGIRTATDQLKDAKEVVLKRLDEKYLPVNLEADILKGVQASIHEAIKNTLGGYNSPMHKLILQVIASHESELKQLISDAFSTVIRTDDFKKAILEGFSHKVARTIISNNDGLFDKVSNDLKQDQTFKAKMTLAVAKVVNECLEERKNKS